MLRFRSAIAVALVAGIISALAPLAALATPHVLSWSDGLDINVLNPLVPGAAPNDYMTMSTGAFLTVSGNGPLEPELATSLPTQQNGGISKDGKTITVHLRPNLKWSDGQPLTSEDVAFSVAAINDPKTNVADRTGYDLISKVDTPNATTVVFHLVRPYGKFLNEVFSDIDPPILPKHLLQGKDINTADYMALPVGAGPFRYSKWLRGDRVELVPNPYYFRGKPKLEKIVFHNIPSEQTAMTALRTGDTDFWPTASKDIADQLKDVSSLSPIVLKGVRASILMLNTQSPIVSEYAVRSALRLALNRASIIERTYHGGAELDESIVSKNDPGYQGIPLVAYDPAKAKATLDAAGWKPGSDGVRVKDGKRLHVTLTGGAGSAAIDQILELIRADWTAVGIEVETRRYPASIMFSDDPAQGILRGGKFDAGLFSFGQIRTTALETYYSCANVSPKASNYSRICDPELERLFKQYNATYDRAVAARIARDVQRRLNELLPTIIVTKRNEYYIKRDTMTGYKPLPFSPFAGTIMNVDVTK